MKQILQIQQAVGEYWIPTIYETSIRPMRTRSFELGVPSKENEPEILHTLLGVELKTGRKRLACPDLQTARYLAIFARIGCPEVAVPYDITILSAIADDLETAWHKTRLIFDGSTSEIASQTKNRLWTNVVKAMREEIVRIGAGTKMPLFNSSTKQRTN